MTLSPATDAGIFARSFEDCVVEIGVASGRVVGVSFPTTAPDDATDDHPLLDRVEAYFDGAADHFDDVQVALTVPTAQRSVLEAVRNVPYGETISVERIARMAGFDPEDSEDVRTVETALRENPVPLFVPDHRVDGPGATPPAVARRLRTIESA